MKEVGCMLTFVLSVFLLGCEGFSALRKMNLMKRNVSPSFSPIPHPLHSPPSIDRRGILPYHLVPPNNQPPFAFQPPRDPSNGFHHTVIKEDQQISAFLYKGIPRMFFYLLQDDTSALSITLTPCTSVVRWSVVFRNSNDTGKVSLSKSNASTILGDFKESTGRTFSRLRAESGLYVVEAIGETDDGWVEIYASRRHPLGSHPALNLPKANIQIDYKRKRGEIYARWPPCPVDPYSMEYWMVLNTRREYNSLCQVEGELWGVRPPEHPLKSSNFSTVIGQAGRSNRLQPRTTKGDFLVEHVGGRRGGSLKGLQPGGHYFLDVFAVDRNSNLSFLYGRVSLVYKRPRPTPLKDAKPVVANLRRSEGRASFSYKARVGKEGPLEWYIIPCGGGTVDAEVRSKGGVLVPRVRVEGFGSIQLPREPTPGARYTLRLNATTPQFLAGINNIEVMASRSGLGLPRLPSETRLHEYRGLGKCHSVTIGWLPLNDSSIGEARYCLRASEAFPNPQPSVTDQCQLEEKLNSLDFVILQCWDVSLPYNGTVMTQTVPYLRPGKTYEIQVTVKKGKSKMLSYKTLHIRTKHSC